MPIDVHWCGSCGQLHDRHVLLAALQPNAERGCELGLQRALLGAAVQLDDADADEAVHDVAKAVRCPQRAKTVQRWIGCVMMMMMMIIIIIIIIIINITTTTTTTIIIIIVVIITIRR